MGPGKKPYENIEKRGAFTIALATADFVKEVDYFGLVSGYRDPDKFSKTGLAATKSPHVDAPIIEGLPLTIECELTGFVRTEGFGTILGRVANIAADESILTEAGKIDVSKMGMIFYDSFSSSYFTLGEKVGKAFGDGRAFL
ncbi:MAG: flavin reductase family protein [Coriobacteriales bacterium]